MLQLNTKQKGIVLIGLTVLIYILFNPPIECENIGGTGFYDSNYNCYTDTGLTALYIFVSILTTIILAWFLHDKKTEEN